MISVGTCLLEGCELRRVELDLTERRARLVCEGATVAFEGVRAATLLAPWDGATGIVEELRVVAVAAGEICLELRVRYATVPRVHRVVCTDVRRE